MQLETCSDDREHICQSGGGLMHHSPLNAPFPDGTTEHEVGKCDHCDGLFLLSALHALLLDLGWTPPETGR